MIAQRLQHLDSSHIRKALSRPSGASIVVDLSIGFPEDNTPDEVKLAGITAIAENFTRYTPSNGIPELRAAVATKLNRENGLAMTPDLVAITPGTTAGILLTYLAILDPGDEILIPDPYFPPYFDLAAVVGATPVAVDTYPSFQLTAELVERSITPRTKALLINSPNNPSGAVYPEGELRRIAEVAREHGLVILSDEIYEYFTYDRPHFSIGSIYPDTVTFNGFSKAYAMTGWRVGYLAGPKPFIEAVNQLQQYAIFSNSSIAERAAVAALSQSPAHLMRRYRRKRDTVVGRLKSTLQINGAQGAFYAFAQLPAGVSDLEFCAAAGERGVIVLPSRVFSKRQDHVRIAFANTGAGLLEGLGILREIVGGLERHDPVVVARTSSLRPG